MKATSLKRKLVFGLSVLIALFVAQAATLWFVQKEVKRDITEAVRFNTLAMAQMSELAVLAQQIRRYEKEYFVYVDTPARRSDYVKEWTKTADQITALLAKMQSNQEKAFQSKDLAQISTWWAAAEFYQNEMRRVFEAVNSREAAVADSIAKQSAVTQPAAAKQVRPADGKLQANSETSTLVQMYASKDANELINAGKTRFSNELIKGVNILHAEKIKATLALEAAATREFEILTLGTAIAVALGAMVAVGLILWLPGAILAPIKTLAGVVEEISLGKVSKPVQAATVEEFVELTNALERMRIAQEAMVQRLRAR